MPKTGAATNRPEGTSLPTGTRANDPSVCWNCEKTLADEDVCPSCVKVQPFGQERDYYSILGLPGRLALDPTLLVSAYHEKSRTFHPDHHVEDSEKVQSITLSNASLVNLAFRTLRDPFQRAQYFIGHIKGEPARPNRKATLPPHVLMEIMELKEELEVLSSGKSSEKAEQRIRAIIEPLEQEIFNSFSTIDSLLEHEGPSSQNLSQALGLLSERLEKRSYLQNLFREVKEIS